MMYLLKLEWLKIKANTTYKVLMLLYLIGFPLFFLLAKAFPSPEMGDAPIPMLLPKQYFEFPHVWNYFGYLGSWFIFFFLGFIAVLLFSNDYNSKTMRQNIITGISRRDYFLSKILGIIMFSLAATFVYAFFGMLYGLLHTEALSMRVIFKDIALVPRFFLMSVGHMSFAFLIVVLTRRGILSLIIYLVYVLGLELMWRWGVHFYLLKIKNVSMHLYPMNVMEDLVPQPNNFPLFGLASYAFSEENGFSYYLSPTQAVIAAIVYIAIFWGLSYYRFQKMNL